MPENKKSTKELRFLNQGNTKFSQFWD